jgi:hypothetical protein
MSDDDYNDIEIVQCSMDVTNDRPYEFNTIGNEFGIVDKGHYEEPWGRKKFFIDYPIENQIEVLQEIGKPIIHKLNYPKE